MVSCAKVIGQSEVDEVKVIRSEVSEINVFLRVTDLDQD